MLVSTVQLKGIGHKVKLHTMTKICMKQEQIDHQKKEGPFIHANVPYVTLFVLDYMHLVMSASYETNIKVFKKWSCNMSSLTGATIIDIK